MRMRVGVVHDLMARRGQGPDGLGVFVDPLPDDEEGGADVVAGQDVDERLCVLVAPGGVEGETDDLVGTVDGIDGQIAGGSGCGQRRIAYAHGKAYAQGEDACVEGAAARGARKSGLHEKGSPPRAYYMRRGGEKVYSFLPARYRTASA